MTLGQELQDLAAHTLAQEQLFAFELPTETGPSSFPAPLRHQLGREGLAATRAGQTRPDRTEALSQELHSISVAAAWQALPGERLCETPKPCAGESNTTNTTNSVMLQDCPPVTRAGKRGVSLCPPG